MPFRFKATETFWRRFHALSNEQKEAVREKWKVFKEDPFDAQLCTHQIKRLSALNRRTVYSVVIQPDLRVLFSKYDDLILTLNVGDHSIYD